MPAHLQVFIFTFGAIVGSFLNAVIWRLRTNESFVGGRSYCPNCRHRLSPFDLVPILSYLLLRGRCRYCRMGICPSYLIVEAVTGLIFLLFAMQAFSGGIETDQLARLLLNWYVTAVMVIVFVYDQKYMLIPRSVTLPAVILAFFGNLALGTDVLHLIMGVLIGGGFFWLQRVLSKGRWVGGGDVHLGLAMGAALSFPLILVALFMAYVVGAVVSVGLLTLGNKAWKSEIPFGTFLSAACVVTLLYGSQILGWYLGLMS